MTAEFDASMFLAAASGDVDKVLSLAATHPQLIDASNVRHFGQTPMHVAASRGRVAVVVALHRLGSTALDAPDRQGRTPAHAAALYGHAAVIEALQRLGRRAQDQVDLNGQSPMILAVKSVHASVVEALIRLGTTPAQSGAYLMALAFEKAHAAVAEQLLAAGVDPPTLPDYAQRARALQAMPAERLLQLRFRLYFSSTLLDLLLTEKR